jgi:hypothetical protein
MHHHEYTLGFLEPGVEGSILPGQTRTYRGHANVPFQGRKLIIPNPEAFFIEIDALYAGGVACVGLNEILFDGVHAHLGKDYSEESAGPNVRMPLVELGQSIELSLVNRSCRKCDRCGHHFAIKYASADAWREDTSAEFERQHARQCLCPACEAL